MSFEKVALRGLFFIYIVFLIRRSILFNSIKRTGLPRSSVNFFNFVDSRLFAERPFLCIDNALEKIVTFVLFLILSSIKKAKSPSPVMSFYQSTIKFNTFSAVVSVF